MPVVAAPPAANASSPPAAASGKGMSAAEKIALMRAKQGKAPQVEASAAQPVVTPAQEAVATLPAPDTSEPAAPTEKALSTAEKLKLMRAKKPPPVAEASPPATAAKEEVAAAAPLSTADKLALMRSRAKPAGQGEVPEPSKPAGPAKAARMPAVPRTALPEAKQVVARPTAAPARAAASDAWKSLQQEFRHEVRSFFLERVRPFLSWGRDGVGRGFETAASTAVVFGRMKAALPSELHEGLADLELLCAQRRQLAEQARLYHWLHGWLVVFHIPAAAALLALVIAHIAAALYW
jgi:hypothetical protein